MILVVGNADELAVVPVDLKLGKAVDHLGGAVEIFVGSFQYTFKTFDAVGRHRGPVAVSCRIRQGV